MRAFTILALTALGCSTCLAAGLPRSVPELQGVSSSGVPLVHRGGRQDRLDEQFHAGAPWLHRR